LELAAEIGREQKTAKAPPGDGRDASSRAPSIQGQQQQKAIYRGDHVASAARRERALRRPIGKSSAPILASVLRLAWLVDINESGDVFAIAVGAVVFTSGSLGLILQRILPETRCG
jgi:hypothetical protein